MEFGYSIYRINGRAAKAQKYTGLPKPLLLRSQIMSVDEDLYHNLELCWTTAACAIKGGFGVSKISCTAHLTCVCHGAGVCLPSE